MASFASSESTMTPSKLRGYQKGKGGSVKHRNKLKQKLCQKKIYQKK